MLWVLIRIVSVRRVVVELEVKMNRNTGVLICDFQNSSYAFGLMHRERGEHQWPCWESVRLF